MARTLLHAGQSNWLQHGRTNCAFAIVLIDFITFTTCKGGTKNCISDEQKVPTATNSSGFLVYIIYLFNSEMQSVEKKRRARSREA